MKSTSVLLGKNMLTFTKHPNGEQIIVRILDGARLVEEAYVPLEELRRVMNPIILEPIL